MWLGEAGALLEQDRHLGYYIWHHSNRRRSSQCAVPGGEWSHGGPEAGHPSGPALPEGLFYELALRGGVNAPERAFAGLLLRAGHFDEVAVQGKVVTDGVLEGDRHRLLLRVLIVNWKCLIVGLCDEGR